MELRLKYSDCWVRFSGVYVGGMSWHPMTAPRKMKPDEDGAGSPEEYMRTRDAILRALAQFPEARAAVVAALKKRS
jgi:hypothetical protein